MTNPTGYTPLDLVGFTDKGTYASNVAYVKNDIVHYAGSLYRCKIDDTTNITPGENANWTVFIGEPSSLVERIIAPLEDNPATVAYTTGRQIIYDDWLWEVIDDIAVGDALVDYAVDPMNANIKKSDPVETQLLEVKAREGNLTNLTTTTKTNLVAALNELDSDKMEVVLAYGSDDLYSTSKAYAVGDVCVHSGKLYRCTTACSAGSWETNSSSFTEITLLNEVNALDDATRANATAIAANAAAITATKQLIAPIETTLTASQAYAIGEQFIYNGLLYEATAAITNGGTITIDGNCSLADSVTEQIDILKSDTGWIRIAPTSSSNKTEYRKIGNIVYVNAVYDANLSDNAEIGTLPVGYRPHMELSLPNYVASNGDIIVRINTDGKIRKIGLGEGWIKCIITYPVS